MPLVDRLFLGGLRNLLAGASAVLHHHPDHRSLSQEGFPVRVQRRYGFAHSPGLTAALRRTYRTSDRRVPWVVRAAEGSDPGLRAEIEALAAANVLRQNTVIVHGTALAPEDGARLSAARASLAWCPESDRRLYGTTAPVAALRAAGVAVGLGSDAPGAGARDALSNLGAARREGAFDDETLLRLATRGSGAVARLPVGGFEEGAVADLLAVRDPGRLLAGDRRAIALLVVRGRAVFGETALVEAAGARVLPLGVDGEPARARGAARAAPGDDPAPPPRGPGGDLALGTRAIIRPSTPRQEMQELLEILSAMAAQKEKVRDRRELLLDMADRVVKTVSHEFSCRADEVAILLLSADGRHLRFAAPRPFADLGSIPVTKRDSIAVGVLARRSGEVINNVPMVKHVSFFESIKLRDKPAPIQKMVTVPLVVRGQPIGVVQISRKGETAREAGPDFSPADLRHAQEVLEAVAPFLGEARPPGY